jgi:IMP dehydrogenase
MTIKQALCFDDVLLVPKQTFGGSRDEVDLSTNICGMNYKIPIISANMSAVTEVEMSDAMNELGGFGILHRMMTPAEQESMLNECEHNTWISIEGSQSGIERLNYIGNTGFDGICIDVAHADSPTVIDTVLKIRDQFGDIPLIIGNYATADAVWRIYEKLQYEVTSIAAKVGVGGGGACTTRVVTGCGLPTFQSILDIRERCPSIKIIADGGMKNSGDIVKALAAGADAVMLGSLLAGTKEAPGNVIKHKGSLYKVYRGSASYGQKFEVVGRARYVEGEETLVPYKGHVKTIVTQLAEGIRSGLSYCGARNLDELHQNAEFVKVTNNGFKENSPHGT